MEKNINMSELLQNCEAFVNKTIYFEGSDYSGKTSYIADLTRNYNVGSRHFLSSRGFPSNIIYGNLFKRNFDIGAQENALKNLLQSNEHFIFFLKPDFEEIERRSSRGDDFIEKKDLKPIYEAYEQFFEKWRNYSNIIWLKSEADRITNLHDKDAYKAQFFNTESSILIDWRFLYDTLRYPTNKIPKIFNYSMKYYFTSGELDSEIFFLARASEKLEEYMEIENLNPLWRTTYRKDVYDRDMLMSQMLFNTHIFMDNYKEPITSRRFVSTNHTSCITNLQFQILENELHTTVNFRSSDVANLLLYDILFIMESAKKFVEFMTNYEFRNNDVKQITRFSFSINISNAHINEYKR